MRGLLTLSLALSLCACGPSFSFTWPGTYEVLRARLNQNGQEEEPREEGRRRITLTERSRVHREVLLNGLALPPLIFPELPMQTSGLGAQLMGGPVQTSAALAETCVLTVEVTQASAAAVDADALLLEGTLDVSAGGDARCYTSLRGVHHFTFELLRSAG